MTALALYLALSLVVGLLVGRYIRVGTVHVAPQQRSVTDTVDFSSIKEKMVERREFDLLGNRVLYRWDFGPYSAHLKFYPEFGDEIQWVIIARNAAARIILKMALEARP